MFCFPLVLTSCEVPSTRIAPRGSVLVTDMAKRGKAAAAVENAATAEPDASAGKGKRKSTALLNELLNEVGADSQVLPAAEVEKPKKRSRRSAAATDEPPPLTGATPSAKTV